MIGRTEVLHLANTLGLEARVIEKDYVLSWVLHSIAQDPVIGPSWIFKGGTCLKKCYFETYRFSEDLDFTVTDPTQMDEAFLLERFHMIGAQLYDKTGIELPAELLRFKVWDNNRGKRAGEGRLSYRGPIAPRGRDLPRIKLDLTTDEMLVLPTAIRPIAHIYSDLPEDGMTARCYCFEEVFGEKIRALGERARPRDLYDVINLFRNGKFQAAAVIRDVVRQKCTFKNVQFPALEVLTAFRDELTGEWQNMLGHQLPALPPVESFWRALPEFFGWLMGTAAPIAVSAYPLAAGDQVLRVPAGAIRIPGKSASTIEVIRFAGSNRLCVDLDYIDEKGRHSTRTIEPYSLRQTKTGEILLHAIRSDSQQHRSYRIDRIMGASVTNRTFAPHYEVELTPTGALLAPESPNRNSSTMGWGFGTSGRRAAASAGPVHLYRCPLCNKLFKHKTRDATLRNHKDAHGWRCSGRRGIYEGTK